LHINTLETWRHPHDFSITGRKGELRTTQVLAMTAITMVVEIIAGVMFGSMALLADGWHMGTHVAAFMITVFAYRYAGKNEHNPQFTFGTGKVSVLGGFTSAVILFVVAMVMAIESFQRIFNPQEIHFNEAIGVALLGLLINVLSAFLLKDDHSHHHGHTHADNHHHHAGHEENEEHDHADHHCHGDLHQDQDHDDHNNHLLHKEADHHKEEHSHNDHNLKAAYFHVMADALTSLLAIVALFFGKMFGWTLLDPIMGIVGALVITRWSFNLLTETSPILLDRNIETACKETIRVKLESDSDNRISDLHLWRVGPNDYAVIISLVTHFPKPVEHYKGLLKEMDLSHVTVEVNHCLSTPCINPATEFYSSCHLH